MIGIDLVSIDRMDKFIKKFPKKALEKFLSPREISLIHSPKNAAGFYAAKEAISKALGTGIGRTCGFKDICIHKDAQGAPYFTLSKHLIEGFSITNTALSITHDGGFAVAVAYLETSQLPKNPLCH